MTPVREAGSLVAEWLAPGGPLARRLSGFEARPQQQHMAAAVARAFGEPHHLAVEAGTGVGKTFAYLLPAIEQIVADPGRRVLISTHTIALQEQLIHKDIPFLQKALGVPFTAELLKGRNNYLGLRRLKQASERQKTLFNHTQLTVLHAIQEWAYRTRDGSLSDLPEAPPAEIWEKVRSEHGNCLGRRCPTFEPCFYQRARRRAEGANLLVVNHALLVSDLALRRAGASVLPDYELAVIDEAHMVDSVATDHFGLSVSNNQVQYLLSGLFNERTGRGVLATIGSEEQKQAVLTAAAACTEFFRALSDWQRTQGRSNGRLVRANVVANVLTPALRAVGETLAPLRKELKRLEDQYELGAYVDRATEIAAAAESLLAQQHPEHVYWIEIEPQRARRVALSAAPLDVGPLLRALLFDRVPSVVMTSATLASDGENGFDYLLQRMGNPPARTLRLGSPFNFRQQAAVHVEAGLPDPSSDAFVPAAAAAITFYLRQTQGRAFVLFTSYSMLNAAAEIVRDDLAAEGYTFLVQGEGAPRSKMLDKFRSTPRAVIFGTDSFWQGVDVVGAALSNVIIVKLPFAVPDRPLIEARIDLIRKRGGDAFVEYQLPEAVLKFRQGFGRLIRSATDHGIVVVLDPRVVRKGYGRRFLDSLPPCRVEISERPW